MKDTFGNDMPNQDSEFDHGSFSRSLVDALNTPSVRVPTTDQLLTKTGPRKKKKEVHVSLCCVACISHTGHRTHPYPL